MVFSANIGVKSKFWSSEYISMPVAEILVFLDLDEKSSFSFGRYLK